jgi:hypothetical protein
MSLVNIELHTFRSPKFRSVVEELSSSSRVRLYVNCLHLTGLWDAVFTLCTTLEITGFMPRLLTSIKLLALCPST